jgi:hypothetical protein
VALQVPFGLAITHRDQKLVVLDFVLAASEEDD